MLHLLVVNISWLFYSVCVWSEDVLADAAGQLWKPELVSDVFLLPLLHLLFLETESLTEPEVNHFLWTDWPEIHLPPLSITKVTGKNISAWLLHGCWGSEPGSSCFTAGSLPTEPSPPPLFYHLEGTLAAFHRSLNSFKGWHVL